MPGAVGRKHLVAEYCEDTQLLRVDSTLDPEFWVEVRFGLKTLGYGVVCAGVEGTYTLLGAFDTGEQGCSSRLTANDEFGLKFSLIDYEYKLALCLYGGSQDHGAGCKL